MDNKIEKVVNVPSSRMLWASVMMIPFLTIIFIVRGNPVYIASGVLLLLLALILIDCIVSRHVFSGFDVKSPELLRMTQEKECKFSIEVSFQGRNLSSLRVGVLMPDAIVVSDAEKEFSIPDGADAVLVDWDCKPKDRGQHVIRECYMEQSSHFGFWDVRKKFSLNSECRVYPSLNHERNQVAGMYMNRNFAGFHLQRQVGQGKEFEKLREYVSGDSFEDIHWKATAKFGTPLTKVYQIETQQDIYVALDVSRLSGRMALKASKNERSPEVISKKPLLEYALNSTLMLGLVSERQKDSFGVLSFSDHVHDFVRAQSGKQNLLFCRDVLYKLQTERVTPDYEELCAFIRMNIRRRSLVILLTYLDDSSLSEGLLHAIKLISKKHLVVVGYFSQHASNSLFSNDEVGNVTDVYEELAGHMAWHDLVETRKKIERAGAMCCALDTSNVASQVISEYLSIKRRQII